MLAENMPPIERSTKEIAAGRLWRAKEILSGSLSNYPFSPELYLAYGEVLLRLGDMREAGRFLFLAATEQKQYSAAIQLYLEKCKNADKYSFYNSFPAKARLAKLSDYPESIAQELKRRGFGEIIRSLPTSPISQTLKDKIMSRIVAAIIFVILILVLVGFVSFLSLGAQTVYKWIS